MVIRQFDVFSNPSVRSRDDAPYVVVLQSQYAGDLPTTVIAPLYRIEIAERMTKLTVDVNCADLDLVASLPELTAVSGALLKNKVGSLAAYEDDIRRAVDRLFTGF